MIPLTLALSPKGRGEGRGGDRGYGAPLYSEREGIRLLGFGA